MQYLRLARSSTLYAENSRIAMFFSRPKLVHQGMCFCQVFVYIALKTLITIDSDGEIDLKEEFIDFANIILETKQAVNQVST